VRVSVEAGSPPVAVRGDVLQRIDSWVRAELPGDWEVELTGPFAIGFDFVHDLQSTQVRSFPVAFLLVTVILVFFLRSFPLALAGMLPTVLPSVVILGAMGFT
jgi:predicted RND superfamily exporter protein